MNYADVKLDDLVNKVALDCKEPGTGYVHRKVVIAEVERLLTVDGIPMEVRGELLRRIAAAEVDRYFNRRKPRMTNQGSLYCADFWLPLGDGKRVQMSDADTADLAAYLRIVEDNRRRVNARADQTAVYVRERVSALDAHPGRRLGWVEENVFGHSVAEVDLDEQFVEDFSELV